MDSQHRHELNENVLAGWLADKIEAVKPHLPIILLVAGATLVGSIFWTSWSNSSSESEAVAWQSYSLAVNSGAPNLPVLERISEDHAGSSVVPWAEVTWADGQLMAASQGWLRNREQAVAALDKAEQAYVSIASTAPRQLRNRAQLGLARVAELRGDAEAAIAAYEQVDGAFAELAQARAEALSDDRVQEDVAWLANAEVANTGSLFGGGPVDQPEAEPDDIELPSDEPASSEDTFSDLLQSIEGAANEAEGTDEADDSAGDSGEEGEEAAEVEDTPESDAAGSEAEEEAPATESTPESTSDADEEE